MKDITWLKKSLIAHRGFHTEDKKIPENSITAFTRALENNYAIELDVQLSSDGVVFVFHDETLSRMTNQDGIIYNTSSDVLQSMVLLNSNETIPTLKTILSLVNGKVPLLIEIKTKGPVLELSEKTAQLLDQYPGTFAIQSFHPKIIQWFKDNRPHFIRGQIASYFKDEDLPFYQKILLKYMVFNRKNKPDFINYDFNHMPNWMLNKAHKNGIAVIGYTAQNQETLDKVKSMYDNAVFEFFTPKA